LKKKIITSHVANHLYDIRSLCNGFLAGVAGVSVGSGGMQPIMALIAGMVSAACYLGACAIFRQFQIDDPMENCQIYIFPIIWSSFNCVLLMDSEHMMHVANTTEGSNNLDLLGT